jgi:hypothetical protein
MSLQINRRLVFLAVAVAGSVAVQGCAVTTRPFVASKATPSNNSMLSYFNAFHQQVMPQATPHNTLTAIHEPGLFDFKYY